MARLIVPKYSTGSLNEGERRVIHHLLNNLPPLPPVQNLDTFGSLGAEYVLIPNIEIPDLANNRFLEIDAVLVAPHAVYVLEVKDWGPRIEGNDFEWVLNGRRERANPHRTLNYKCRVLKSILGKASADMYRKVWYQGVVVIARDNVQLDLTGNCESATFLLDSALLNYLQDPLRLATPQRVSEDAIAAYQKEIVDTLYDNGRGRRDGPLVIAGHQVEERLLMQEGLTEYLGRSTLGGIKGSLKRLRVFTLPYLTSQAEQDERQKKILRDYEALESIGSHPNIVSLKGFYEHESEQVVEVLDWSEEGTLRTVLTQDTLTVDQKISVIRGVAAGLEAAHKKGIIHRDVRPENILMGPAGPQLMNFDRAFMHSAGTGTVWQTIGEGSPGRRYLPPELALPKDTYDVFDGSDLYSLGVTFYELLCGGVPFEGPEGLEAVGGILPDDLLPTWQVPGLPPWVDEVVRKLYASDVRQRYGSASELLADLERKLAPSQERATGADIGGEETVGPSPPSSDPDRIYSVGERVGDYRIINFIKVGGFAQVYAAVHTLQDKEYALKVNNQLVPLDALIDEFSILDQITHPNIVKVNWSGQLPGGRYYIAMEYLKGEPLSDYAWGSKRLTLSQCLDVGRDVLAALRYLHEGGQKSGALAGKSLYHRDVKPNNIIWVQGRGFVLIDFNIAKEAAKSQTLAGTPPYMAPDLIRGTQVLWDESGDTFALGVTLYELICKAHPYANREPRVSVSPADPRSLPGNENLPSDLCDFLLMAVRPRAANRFRTAKEMEDALAALRLLPQPRPARAAATPVVFELDEAEIGLENYNPFVRRLRRLFSQALHSNAGTRGLDEIARLTYIKTKLDEELLPAILEGRYRLIIITGNAGDGKTALIQQLEEAADNFAPLVSKNGSRFTVRGVPFETNYDGSQDEGDVPNDVVLERFLSPFAGLEDMSGATEGRVLAINEGRLMEFLGAEERKESFGLLYEAVDAYFNERGETTLPAQMMVVNLNWRSVVAGAADSPSILEKQLTTLLKDEFWAACGTCDYKDRCFIHHNAMSLRDAAAGGEIRSRLSRVFEAVHLRRQLHITMRDLRSALSFTLCRDRGCEDIPVMLDGLTDDAAKLDYAGLAYWNVTDDGSRDAGSEDRLISLLRGVDVGQLALPAADRNIHFLPVEETALLGMAERQGDYAGELLRGVHRRVQELALGEVREQERALVRRQHKLLARKFYFEGRDPALADRTPYKFMAKFKEVLGGVARARAEACEMLVSAISLGEGCRNRDLALNNICISASEERDPRWATFRLFPAADFEIVVPALGSLGGFLEHTADRFVMRHKHHPEVALEVDLDLYELAAYVAGGFSPSLNDLHGRYIELIIFKNALQHLPYRSVLVTEDHRTFYRVAATPDNTLILERA